MVGGKGVPMTTTLPPRPTLGGFRIDPELGAVALRAPAASWEDSCPHAILKLQPRNCFDYRVRYESQLMKNVAEYKIYMGKRGLTPIFLSSGNFVVH